MEKIIPRWEWRTFGEDLSKGEKNIKTYGNARHRESKEIYILSKNSNDNIQYYNLIIFSARNSDCCNNVMVNEYSW